MLGTLSDRGLTWAGRRGWGRRSGSHLSGELRSLWGRSRGSCLSSQVNWPLQDQGKLPRSLLSVFRSGTSPSDPIPSGLRQEAAHSSGLGFVPTRLLNRWGLNRSQGSLARYQAPSNLNECSVGGRNGWLVPSRGCTRVFQSRPASCQDHLPGHRMDPDARAGGVPSNPLNY